MATCATPEAPKKLSFFGKLQAKFKEGDVGFSCPRGFLSSPLPRFFPTSLSCLLVLHFFSLQWSVYWHSPTRAACANHVLFLRSVDQISFVDFGYFPPVFRYYIRLAHRPRSERKRSSRMRGSLPFRAICLPSSRLLNGTRLVSLFHSTQESL